jgi:hypothetical protein
MRIESEKGRIEYFQNMYFSGFAGEFAKTGWNLADTAKPGILCCDVGEGPEIGAFTRLKPVQFIVTEPRMHISEEADIDKSLDKLSRNFPVTILRSSPVSAMQELSNRGFSFGLITHLYMFPTAADYETVTNFICYADRLLNPGGTIALSVDCPRWAGHYGGFSRAVEFLQKMHYESHLIKPAERLSSGGLFIFGRKSKVRS